MTARKLILTTVFALLYLSIQAQPVSESEALQQACQFLQQRGKASVLSSQKSAVVKGRRAAGSGGHNSYYVFNVGSDEGFVIVSGDSRAAAILGYADSGSITVGDMPDGLRFLLDCYAEEVAGLAAGDSRSEAAPSAATRHRSSTPHHAIAPFVATRWNQGMPYNALCPSVDDEQCVTGCVATAMAQVMYHHRWPQAPTTAIPAYTTRTRQIAVEALPATTFDWKAMTTTYGRDYSGTSAEVAVATLMQYCGVSLQMDYNVASVGGSSAYNVTIAEALRSYFGYKATYAKRQHYNYTEWVDMVYDELADGRPVVLGGQGVGGGHSFVCDGYDTDDYFHINWGWGGTDDGFFRLSALNPKEQGIGGSSTLDGFSFTQDAVVGIMPGGSDPAVCLSLERLQFDASGLSATQTVSRETAGEAFTGISLYTSLCNCSFGTSLFDYAVVLTDAEGTELSTLFSQTGVSMPFNKDLNITLTDLSTPTALADGTYYIKVVSRLNGQSEWQECYDGQQQRIEVVVSGNSMTLTAPFVSGTATLPVAVTFTVQGNQTQGYEQTVIASITGGATDYHGNLVLRVNNKAVMGKSVEIPAGQTVDVRFSYIPGTAGDNVLALYTHKTSGQSIGSTQTISIAASDATDNLDLVFSAVIDNQTANGQLYGNALRATVTVSNPSAEYDYVGQLNCSARQWTKTVETIDNGDGTTSVATSWAWESLGVTSYPLTVTKGGTTVLAVAADNLPAEGCYSFRISYQRVADGDTVADGIHLGLVNDGLEHGSLTMTDGYQLGDATGTVTVHAPAAVIDAADACFVDLRGLLSLKGITVTPSSNPNCLYLLADGSDVPSGLDGCNVVCGTAADNLNLTDGYDFYSPVSFTASAASYTRTFTQPATGTAGWTTLMLPFAATTVTVLDASSVERERTWFRSDDDEDGSFWLRSFTADAEGIVTFGHTQQMEANTPYIIAVPGDTWGDEWQMTGRPVTFSTTQAAIAATTAAAFTGSSYKFCGATIATTVADAYVLNDRGSRFVHTAAETVIPPFRAWFQPVSISSLTLPALAIGSSSLTAIRLAVSDVVADGGWFTLSGQRLHASPTAPGLYIYNGKKTIVK